MKNISELKEGKCTIVAVSPTGANKEFKGHYNSKLNIVFFTINDSYKILGYLQ